MAAKKKLFRITLYFIAAMLAVAAIGYQTLSNRHKAIVKTYLLYKTGLADSHWQISNTSQQFSMMSPDFLIDGIYKSMEGPKSSNYIQLSKDSTLLWMTGFEVQAYDAKTKKRLSNDFICHTNVDFNDARYFGNFGLKDRIGKQYPRLTSLSNGMETFSFPKGFGVPMRGNDLLYITTQALNHNFPDLRQWVKHKVTIRYSRTAEKPLMSRTVFIALPYDQNDPYKSPLDPGKDFCIPVETKNHSYDDGKGHKLSGHWVIPKGKNIYRSSINAQLQLTDSLRLHAAAVHVHPFATALTLFDKTDQKIIFKSQIENYKDKTGLRKVAQFSSELGIWLYGRHDYELILEVNNTTTSDQDMMGSMFLFFYDAELQAALKKAK